MNPEAFDLINNIPTYKLFIGGKWVRSSRNSVVDDFNPATGAVFARMQQAGPEEVDQALAAGATQSLPRGLGPDLPVTTVAWA